MTSMRLPWWAKISMKLILARLPFGYAAWQRLGLFRHGRMDISGYAIEVFGRHAVMVGHQNSLSGKTVLELGPGDSIATAVIAAAHGAKAILVDTGRYVRPDIAPCIELGQSLSEMGLRPPDLSACAGVDEVLALCGAQYMTDGLASLKRIEAQSVDWMFSQAVLEHVRRREFVDTMRECRRILKPGGIGSHKVDLRDHLSDALNTLRFGERIWESELFAQSGFYTNRIRFGEMSEFFRQAGFDVEVTGVRRWSSLPTPRNRLAHEYREMPGDDLCVSGFDVLLRPKEPSHP